MQEYEAHVRQALPDASSIVMTGDGYKFEIHVVCASFAGKGKLARHKAIYAALSAQISSGEIHALSIHALTPEEAAAK